MSPFWEPNLIAVPRLCQAHSENGQQGVRWQLEPATEGVWQLALNTRVFALLAIYNAFSHFLKFDTVHIAYGVLPLHHLDVFTANHLCWSFHGWAGNTDGRYGSARLVAQKTASAFGFAGRKWGRFSTKRVDGEPGGEVDLPGRVTLSTALVNCQDLAPVVLMTAGVYHLTELLRRHLPFTDTWTCTSSTRYS